MLLCLSVLLMACACAAETMEPSAVSETESQAPAPQFTLSEVNAESSKTEEPAPSAEPSGEIPPIETSDESLAIEESDVVIEPIQPIVPVEKETTLEKVLSFDIGINGMIEYNFIFYDDPSTADIATPGSIIADGGGNFYHQEDCDIIRLNDGAKFTFVSWTQVLDIEVLEDQFYVLKANETGMKGVLYHYDISDGFETPLLKEVHENLPAGNLGIANGNPVIMYQNIVYDTDGKKLTGADRLFSIIQTGETVSSIKKENGILAIRLGEDFRGYVPAVADFGIVVAEYKKNSSKKTYTSFDQDGNIKSKFLLDEQYDGLTVPCNRNFVFCGELKTVKSYHPYGATLGGETFEDLIQSRVFFDAYGNAYFAAYYLDHCDVYTINQGYSDIQFPVDEELQAGDSSIAPTSSASGSSASSVQWVSVTREQAETNALAMINLDWTIRNGNLEERTNAELPTYLDPEETGKKVGDQEFGIPYCKGGNYGKEEFRFKQQDDLGGGYYRMTGNIKDVSGHQPQTIGLDCARFVGKSLSFSSSSGYSPGQFINLGYGHVVSSVEELKKMDLIISSSHAMFFNEVNADDQIIVYDTTSVAQPEKTYLRNTGYTEQNLINQGYQFVHLYSTIGYDSTQHWTECASCGQYKSGYENHTMELSETGHFQKCTGCDYMVVLTPHTFAYTVSSSGHVGTCTLCGYTTETASHELEVTGVAGAHFFDCSICGFSSGPIPHTFGSTYTHTATQHTRTCTGCGYSVSTAHTFTYTTYNLVKHRQTCSTCGYSVTEAHTLHYHYDADGHWQECSLCSFETASLAHNFADSRCTVCGCPQHIIMDIIAIPEEDEPLPVPEDQKATL